VRLALIPVFLVLALSSDEGTDALPLVLFMVIAGSDYADGIAARVTGQYSRFGTLLDPFVDRLLVIAGIVVCWDFELLHRWALAAVVVREGLLLVGGRIALENGVEWKINWPGRLAVWPTMGGIALALLGGVGWVANLLFLIGLVLAWMAAVGYVVNAKRQLDARSGAPSGSP
jgi:cardiolipin synthase